MFQVSFHSFNYITHMYSTLQKYIKIYSLIKITYKSSCLFFQTRVAPHFNYIVSPEKNSQLKVELLEMIGMQIHSRDMNML